MIPNSSNLISCTLVPSSMIPNSSNLISCTLVPSSTSFSLVRSKSSPSSSSTCLASIEGSILNISTPDRPPVFPALKFFAFLAISFFSLSFFSFSFFFFQATKVSSVTLVSLDWSRPARSFSISSSMLIAWFSLSILFLSFLSTKSLGRACLYLHCLPPLGHSQNQPYLLFSSASRKFLQMMSVSVLPACFLETTSASFSSVHSSMSSSSSCSYTFLFTAFLSTSGSWENLHLSPFLHRFCLKNWQKTVFGSTPASIF